MLTVRFVNTLCRTVIPILLAVSIAKTAYATGIFSVNASVKKVPLFMQNKIIVCVVYILTIFFYNLFSTDAEAKRDGLSFYGDEIIMVEEDKGNIKKTNLCTGRIDVRKLGIYNETIDSDAYMSPNKKFFVFQGGEGRQGRLHWFVVDIANCKVIKKINIEDDVYHSYDYHVAFSPDSKRIIIQWSLLGKSKQYKDKTIVKEFSDSNYNKERTLEKIIIPGSAHDGMFFSHRYKFSYDGKYLVVLPNKLDTKLTVFDAVNDIELFGMGSTTDYFGNLKISHYELLPEINNDKLLFSFKSDLGTSLYVFNYVKKNIENKIEVSKAGTGRFSIKGDKIIFSTPLDSSTWKKEIIVFDVSSGKELGKAFLDEAEEIIDVSDDANKIIYKVQGQQKEMKIIKK